MKNHPAPTRASGLLMLGFGLLSAPLQQALAADGTWIGNLSNVAPNGVYTNPLNWAGGVVASGTDSTANFIYNPVSDTGVTGPSGGLIFDASQTLGNLVFDDTDGYGSATIGFNQAVAATPLNLTLDTTTGTPTITTGQLLNSISGGKKVVINHNIIGTDGLTTNGPGYLGFRGSPGTTGANTSTISGALTVEGGVVQVQSQFGSITTTTVRNGATLFLDFSASGAAGTNRINAASPLTLGGAGGGGVVANGNAAATATHSQTFAGVTLNTGTHQIIAVTNTNQNMTYNLGTITNSAKSALNLAKPTAAGTGVINLANANTNGIIGGWATWNSGDWAINNGSGAAAAFTAYIPDAWAAGNHTNVALSQSLTAATTDTLRINSGTAFTLNLSGTNTIQTGGLISSQQSPLITGGKLTSGTADFITHVNGGVLRMASDISDNGAPVTLVKSLVGTLQLENNMSYTGGTVLGAGTIIVGKGPLGGSTGNLGSGAVLLSANNTGTGVYNPSGTLAFNRSGTYTLTNAVNPAINGGGYLAQVAGNGTLILNQGMKVGGFIQQAGTTRLDFNAASAPVSQIIDGAFTTGPTTIHTGRLLARNGRLEIQGKTGAATQQNFALTEVLGSVNVALTPGSAGGTASLALGALSRPTNSTDGGGTLAFTLPAGTTALANSGNASLILADAGVAYTTVNGNEWGAKDATNTQIVAGSTIGGFYTATTGAGLAAATNVDVTLNDSVTGAIQTNSLRFDTAAANTITVNAAGTLRPGGILVSSNVGANITTITGAGDLRAPTGNRDIPIIQNNTRAALVIAAPIVNFDATNTTSIVKAGAGELELTSPASTFTGRTFVSEGILRLSGSAQIGTTTTRTGSVFGRGGELVIQDTAKIFTGAFGSIGQRQGENGTLTVKGSGLFDIAGDFNIGDVNARGVLNISDNASLVVRNLFVGKGGYSEGIVNQSGGSLVVGNTPSADWNLGGNGAGDTAATGTYNLSGGTVGLLTRNFQIGRNGTGFFNVSGSGAVSGTGFHVIGRFHSGTGTVNITDNGTWDANTGGTGANFFIVGESGTGTLNIGGGVGTPTLIAKNLSLAHNGGKGTVNQTGGLVDLQSTTAISASVNAGVVFGQTATPGLLVPDYRGTYNLSGGVLKTFGVRENTALTIPVNSTFNFNGGTVQAIGNNAVFMDNLDLAAVQAGGAVVDTNTFSITIAQNLLHDAALGATLDGGLNKAGNGTLTLTGTNTYTGSTTVSGGTLQVNGNHSAATGAITVNSGATLGGTGTLGSAVTFASGSTFAPGTSPGTLTTNSSAVFAPTTTLSYELNGGDQTVGGGINDLLTGVTTLTLNGTLNVTETIPGSFSLTTSGSWRLINYTGTLSGGGLTLGSTPTLPLGYNFVVDTATAGQVNLNVVPEPAITGLLGGLLALAGFRRRRAR